MTTTNRVTARDLMRTDVQTLSPSDTIETAQGLFEEARISGAPVVASGRLVGVLSLADIASPEHQREGRLRTQGDYELAEPVGEERVDELDPEEVVFRKEDYSPEVLGRELVGDWMSTGVVTVAPTATLERVCQTMAERSIHRVFVTEGERLLGVISSLDVVRHVAGLGRRPVTTTGK
ncbi:MAG TPA: CBS domain-containing protein [Planctomycetota bacterium]